MTAPERQSIWRAFIEQCDDEELDKVDLEKFNNCMVAAYAQLLSVAVVRTQKKDAYHSFKLYLYGHFKTMPEADQFTEEFNRAFGGGGIDGMANAFANMMEPLDISPDTTVRIYHEFSDLIRSMIEILKRLKLVEYIWQIRIIQTQKDWLKAFPKFNVEGMKW